MESPGMNAHRIEVLDRTDDHDVVVQVAHHLHLVFFPTDDRLFDQHLRDGRLIQAALHQGVEVLSVVGDRRTRAPHGEAGSYDGR